MPAPKRVSRLGRIFWIGAAAILIVAALVALVAVLRGDFSDTDGRILFTLAALLYTGGTALAGLALVDRRIATRLGWLVAAAAPVCLTLSLWGIWSFVFDGGEETPARLAWSGILLLLAGLVAATALLLATRRLLVRLAWTAAGLAGVASTLSVLGIWTEPEGDAFVKVVSALWILTVLAYFLVPILQRFSTAGAEHVAPRVLAELDGVQLVATRSGGMDPQLAAGERLELRRRA